MGLNNLENLKTFCLNPKFTDSHKKKERNDHMKVKTTYLQSTKQARMRFHNTNYKKIADKIIPSISTKTYKRQNKFDAQS